MKNFFILTIIIFSFNEINAQNNLSKYLKWRSYGVRKVEMAIPGSYNKWEEVLILSGETVLKINNERDIYIDDLDLLDLIIGRNKIGRFDVAVFENGASESTPALYTKRFSGRLELLFNDGSLSMSGDAVLDFFYSKDGKLGIVLIANRIGKTKAKIWLTEDIGPRILYPDDNSPNTDQYPRAVEIGQPKEDEISTTVEGQPQFPGGIKEMYGFISRNLKYPTAAQGANVSGKVFAKFVVEEDGSLGDVEILKGIGFGCDEEAKRVLKSMPKWIPAKINGFPVKSFFTTPISFIPK